MLGPLLAVLGVVAVAAVLRTRWRVRHSLYESLRAERQRQVDEARRRAIGEPAAPVRDAALVDSRAGAVVREPALQTIAGSVALVAALLMVLLGVLILVGAAH